MIEGQFHLRQPSTHSAAAASSPAFGVARATRVRNATEQVWPRGSRLGSE